jgi:hypothetical protein
MLWWSADGNAADHVHDLLARGTLVDPVAPGQPHDHPGAPEVSMKPGEMTLTRTPFGPAAITRSPVK